MSHQTLLEARPWLRHYEPGVPHTIAYPARPLQHFLDDAAARFPDRPAVTFFGRDLTYRDLRDLADRFAGGLRALGLQPGDRVSLHLPNCPQFVIAYYGTLKAGGVVVPFNPLYVEREIAAQMADCGATVAVTLDLFADRVLAARAGSRLAHVVVTRINEFFPPVLRALYPLRARRHGQWPPLAFDAATHPFSAPTSAAPLHAQASQSPADLAVLLYTGGTTGTPKGTMLTHGNLVANTYQSVLWYPNLAGEVITVLGVLPLFHAYAMTVVMNSSLLRAGRMVLLPRFETEAVLKAIARYRPQQLPGVPTLYNALVNHPKIGRYDLRSIRTCISGAAALPAEVQSRFERITGGTLVEGYGLTEASPVTHITPLAGLRKPGSIGVPAPDTDARIVDLDTGTRTLPRGEIGELVVRGPQVMAGYWNRPQETSAALRDGWLYTGDIARKDEDGYFYVVDRKKEMLITGGFNVYPRDVEEVLYAHPAVLEAALVAIPDRHWGEVGKAFIVLRPGARATAEELLAHCRQHLAPYKVPAAVEFRETLPKSMIGKVLRRVLAEEERASRA
ncbi:MAG: long-chain fatty acid--CoA ligase [Armatimonadetes bacterium]|nr:long-chain fatty acid--CoA ligase [Armatimonadota bacterium]